MWTNNGPICINLKKMLQHLSGLMDAGFRKNSTANGSTYREYDLNINVK
jgi:hypothetical protein